ncbi:MAG: ATP-dependent Clp protease ATP-binding subunit, partial [Planctomycetota bacterium]|nr:ATP-dependent Clp protease ATP-binding subunit [Planctomycetota bacterium]
ERRFQTIIVEQPSKEETLAILRGLQDRYEAHHKVRFTDEALFHAVELSTRYITGRCLPDKAIDVIDESGARVRLKNMTPPPDLTKIEGNIEKLQREKDEAVKNADYERAASLRDEAQQLLDEKTQMHKKWYEENKEATGVVDNEIIAEVVSNMTGVPLTKLEKKETQRLLELESELHKTVVSQDEAITALAKAVRRSRSGLKDPNRPMGCFILLGPSGVGKTLLAQALAEFMFSDRNSLIRLDMSEFMEKHNVSRLVGAPPGYVGYEEGGQLTERIRRRPYSVLLLDEIEKAHPDVYNILLQIMDEGRLTDSFGRSVDFKNVVLIMTSNIGADLIKNQSGFGFGKKSEEANYEKMKDVLQKEVEHHFRPEFLNRLDDTIVFKALTRENLKTIVEFELAKVFKRLVEHGLKLELTEQAKEFLIDKGYNPEFGARPLRRAIEHYIEDPLSESVLAGEFEGKNFVKIDVLDEEHLKLDGSQVPEPEKTESESEPAVAQSE